MRFKGPSKASTICSICGLSKGPALGERTYRGMELEVVGGYESFEQDHAGKCFDLAPGPYEALRALVL